MGGEGGREGEEVAVVLGAAAARNGNSDATAAAAAIEYSVVVKEEAAAVVVVVLLLLVETATVVVVLLVKEDEGAPTVAPATEAAAVVVLPTPSFSRLNPSHHSSASPCSVARTCLRAVTMSSLSYEPKARMYASKLTVASLSAAVGWSRLMGGVTPRYGRVVLVVEGVGGAMVLASCLERGKVGAAVQHGGSRVLPPCLLGVPAL